MIDYKNIFDKGLLVNLNLGSYQARNKVPKSYLTGLSEEEKNLVRAVHDGLSDKSHIDEINSFDNKVRIYVKQRTVPFPIEGVYFILGKDIEEILKYIEVKKEERMKLVNEFADKYEDLVKDFSEQFPRFYKLIQHKYPTKAGLIDRYYFNFSFFQVSTPNKELAFVTPELYKAEMSKFKSSVDEMKKEVVNIIYTELLDKINNLKTQCITGKPSQKTFNYISKFMDRIDDTYSDFIERDDIRNIIAKVKSELGGVEAKELRDDDKFKSDFGKKMKEVVEEIKNLPDTKLKRAIEL